MHKNKKLLAMLLVLAFASVSDASVNSLVDIDITKSGSDTVNFNLYSSNPTASNAMVRQKGDNKYVILIPNTTSNISKVNFSSLKDVISNVEIKTVSDTADGYTKVTIDTKQPLNINAKTVKSKPVTQEQIAYRTLLEEANTPKQNRIETVSKPVKSLEGNMIVQPSNSTTAKTQVKPSPKPISQAVPSASTVKPSVSKSQPAQTQNNSYSNNIQKNIVKSVNDTTQNRDISKEKIVNQTEEIKSEEIIDNNIQESFDNSVENNNKSDSKIILGSIVSRAKSDILNLAHKIKNAKRPETPDIPEIPLSAQYIAGGILMIYLFKKLFGKKSADKKPQFVPDYYSTKASDEGVLNNKYAAITGNDELSWKDKYDKYNEVVNNPEAYESEKLNNVKNAKKVRYKFISRNNIDKKRENLEDMYKTGEDTSGKLYSEDDTLPLITDDIKIKGFENNSIDMKQTDRHKSKSRFTRYEKIQEKAPVELGLSKLNRNMRKFADGNLNVFDVKRKSKSIRELKRVEDLKNQEYLMSSLDEFFSVMDEEPVKQNSVVEPEYEHENYRTIRMISRVNMPKNNSHTGINLDKAFHNEQPAVASSGLNVTSSYDIDENRGFYLVNVDGKSAIIAKSGENFHILKQFDSIIEKPLQVREDRKDVYIVKTDGFKSLVELSDSKVGVLVEL